MTYNSVFGSLRKYIEKKKMIKSFRIQKKVGWYSNCLFSGILGWTINEFWGFKASSSEQLLQVNFCKKHLFLDQLTHNKTKDCLLVYQFCTWKRCVHKLFLFLLWLSEQFMYTTCSKHVLSLHFLCTEFMI